MSNTLNPSKRNVKIHTSINSLGEVSQVDLVKIRESSIERMHGNPNLKKLEEAFAAANQKMTIVEDKPSPPLPPKSPPKIKVENIVPNTNTTEEPAEIEINNYANVRIENSLTDLGEHAIRTDLPSNCIFYNFNTLSIRPFSVPDIARIATANNKKRDDIIIDTVSNVIDVDAWDLTEKDFRFLLYWLRINSFLRSPYKLTWQSIYGNSNELSINKTNLKTNTLQASRDEYINWMNRGYIIPSMRDLQEYIGLENQLSDDDKFLWLRAKYIRGENVRDKLAIAKKLSPDELFIDCNEFIEKFENYGVIETVEVVDSKFQAFTATNYLKDNITKLTAILDNDLLVPEVAASVVERCTRLKNEINRIEEEISNTGEAAPLRETVTFKINVTNFFPYV